MVLDQLLEAADRVLVQEQEVVDSHRVEAEPAVVGSGPWDHTAFVVALHPCLYC